MQIIVANLKMHLDYERMLEYKERIKKFKTKKDIIICPSDIFLPLFKAKKYHVGAQNCYIENEGPYTGETSPWQLKSVGVGYVIIGHSERRQHFNEDNNLINKKCKIVLDNQMVPILCIGETKEEKEKQQTEEVIEKQLIECLADVNDVSNMIFAYEPVWSIGTGLVPTADEIKKVIAFIRETIRIKYKQEVIVLYGGSVNKDDIEQIETISEVDGILVGTACVDIDNFIEMIKIIK